MAKSQFPSFADLLKASIAPLKTGSTVRDPLSEAEDEKYEQDKREREAELEAQELKQNISERKKYASKTFRLICWWLGGVFFLLFLDGFNAYWLPFTFQLKENVLLAVIGGTTLNVIGIFIFVMKYLFNPKK